jgi:hypothetical protein
VNRFIYDLFESIHNRKEMEMLSGWIALDMAQKRVGAQLEMDARSSRRAGQAQRGQEPRLRGRLRAGTRRKPARAVCASADARG